MKKEFVQIGVGVGYRAEMSAEIQRNLHDIDFVEFIGDHCFDVSTLLRAKALTAKIPNVCHFLSLSLGTDEPLDQSYVSKISDVITELRPVWLSDHLAMTKAGGVDIGHLAPATFTEETVDIVARKIIQLQDRFGLPLLLENITYYFALPGGTLTEGQLLKRIVERADCGILLDLNNLYVNAYNNHYDPYEFLNTLPMERVIQVHIGGCTMRDGVLIDSHAHAVQEPIFEYLRFVCNNSPVAAILLERDRDFPPFEELAQEMRRARSILCENRRCTDSLLNIGTPKKESK